MQSQGLSALPLPTIYRGTHELLQYVLYMNENMLNEDTNMKMPGLQKRYAQYMALIFSAPEALKAHLLIDFSIE